MRRNANWALMLPEQMSLVLKFCITREITFPSSFPPTHFANRRVVDFKASNVQKFKKCLYFSKNKGFKKLQNISNKFQCNVQNCEVILDVNVLG